MRRLRAGVQWLSDAAIGERGRYAELARARQLARLGADEVAREQQRRLTALLRHAGQAVPYWRAVFAQAGVDPGRATSADLARLPVLRKRDIRGHGPRLIADTHRGRRLMRRATGGSTGEPLVFFVTRGEYERQMGTVLRSFELAGLRLGDMVAKVWGYAGANRLANALAPVTGRMFFDAFDTSERALDGWLDRLRRHRAVGIYGYASAVAELARRAAARGFELPALRAVCTTAEQLFPAQRVAIETGLGARVYDMYGCHEVPRLASECAFGSMHTAPDAAVIEIVDGRVLLTSLQSRAMPLIRYDVGDRARFEPGPCGCGLAFPRLAMDAGKAHHVFRFPGGDSMHTSYLFQPLYAIDALAGFQIRHAAPTVIELRALPHPGRTSEALAAVERAAVRFRARWRGAVRVEVLHVEAIEPTARGKRPFIVSAVAADASPPGDTAGDDATGGSLDASRVAP